MGMQGHAQPGLAMLWCEPAHASRRQGREWHPAAPGSACWAAAYGRLLVGGSWWWWWWQWQCWCCVRPLHCAAVLLHGWQRHCADGAAVIESRPLCTPLLHACACVSGAAVAAVAVVAGCGLVGPLQRVAVARACAAVAWRATSQLVVLGWPRLLAVGAVVWVAHCALPRCTALGCTGAPPVATRVAAAEAVVVLAGHRQLLRLLVVVVAA